MGLKILGTGSCVPQQVITNDDLTKILDTSDEWIRTRTGIETRHILSDGETLTDLGAVACERALDMAGTDKSEIDLLILCTVCSDYISPSGSALLQKRLGLSERCITLDQNAGCCGFIYGLKTASAYLEAGMAKKVLLLSAEGLSHHADWTDRSTCCLFGDAAGAVVLEHCADTALAFNFKVDGGAEHLSIGRSPDNCPYHTDPTVHKLSMDGQDIYKFAVSSVSARIEEILEENHLSGEDISAFFLHQANMRIINSAIRKTHQPAGKFPHNIEHYGNTSSATVPVLLDEENRKGHIERGQKIVLCAFGAGLSSAACLLEW